MNDYILDHDDYYTFCNVTHILTNLMQNNQIGDCVSIDELKTAKAVINKILDHEDKLIQMETESI